MSDRASKSGALPTFGIEALFREGRSKLISAGKDEPEIDAAVLLEHATGHGALTRLTNPQLVVSDRQAKRFNHLIERRINGEPVHRITGVREFYGLPIAIGHDTLVPRPDTEILIDMAIPVLRKITRAKGDCRILDLGTGTGAIALALLNEVPEATAIGVDISMSALTTAKANAEALGLETRFTALQSNWLENVEGQFDLIISNPPYIEKGHVRELDIEVRDHDPHLALDGGIDGLDAYAMIAADAATHLVEDGAILVEIGWTQKDAVTTLFELEGFRLVNFGTDLAGRDRALCFALQS
ncbi:MAG: peptide chain release factor N(5)-glutamine methyltransferase [Pseudomonadota bacterium]